MDQRSKEWFDARRGKVTASRIYDIMAKTKSGFAASRKNYLSHLVMERLTNTIPETFTNTSMQWGIEYEPQARSMYEFQNDVKVQEVGFVDHPRIANTGASPDGLIGNDGLIEIKCPTSSVHMEYMMSENTPQRYMYQMQWQMACTERAWCDFVSFDPRFSGEYQMFSMRVYRNQETIDELESEVVIFLEEVEIKYNQLTSKIGEKNGKTII